MKTFLAPLQFYCPPKKPGMNPPLMSVVNYRRAAAA